MAVAARNAAYDMGLRRSRALPLPSLGVGNLAVGGTGKTPVTGYLARELVRRGLRPGIVLRGYGGDEEREHAAAVPEAIVVADPDRQAAAVRAAAAGAEVLVLDDCLQRRDVAVDVMVAVVAAETWSGWRLPLPAGAWREGAGALGRADAVLVTCKTAATAEGEALATRLAPRTRGALGITVRLAPAGFHPLGAREPVGPEVVRGRDVVALCAIGEPELFAAQLERLDARVTLAAFGDHHAYAGADVAAARARAGVAGLVVTTAKDAVKLNQMWPAGNPQCLVMELEVRPAGTVAALDALLDRVAAAARATTNPEAAAPPSRPS
ncbi:MAG TPA: hypothetical protein DCP63_09300 [Bacteroidetes bacterium]|nr:hypothetical protein [Bacteroidota bacterium]